MKSFTAKIFSIMMLASLFSLDASANYESYSASKDCCPRQYECGCNPLYCGAWDLQVQVGVNPILWRNRGAFLFANCEASPTIPLGTFYESALRFSTIHKTPWIVGGQVGYALSDNTRLFVEFDYSQAKGKNNVLIPPVLAGSTATWSFGKYKLFEGYVGARYYSDRWCDKLAFFLGGKVGFTHHKKEAATLLIELANFNPVENVFGSWSGSNTVVAGGGHIGLDYCICGNWSLILTGEIVASCGPKTAVYLQLPPNENLNGIAALFPGSIGTELRFPVTAAIRYSF